MRLSHSAIPGAAPLVNVLGTDAPFREFAIHGFLQWNAGLGTASIFSKYCIRRFLSPWTRLGTDDRFSKKDIPGSTPVVDVKP